MRVGRSAHEDSGCVITDHEGNTAQFMHSTTDYGDHVAESTQILVKDENGSVMYGASELTHKDGTVEKRSLF